MTEWIIICNPKKYDVVSAFKNLKILNWKQTTNIKQNDLIYIYCGKPLSKIGFKCIVRNVNKPFDDIDDSRFEIDNSNYNRTGRYIELELLNVFDDERLNYKYLKKNGLNTVQGPSRINEDLSNYIRYVERTIWC